jgi:hypothetical protein
MSFRAARAGTNQRLPAHDRRGPRRWGVGVRSAWECQLRRDTGARHGEPAMAVSAARGGGHGTKRWARHEAVGTARSGGHGTGGGRGWAVSSGSAGRVGWCCCWTRGTARRPRAEGDPTRCVAGSAGTLRQRVSNGKRDKRSWRDRTLGRREARRKRRRGPKSVPVGVVELLDGAGGQARLDLTLEDGVDDDHWQDRQGQGGEQGRPLGVVAR